MARPTNSLGRALDYLTSANSVDDLLRGAVSATHTLFPASVAWVVLLSGGYATAAGLAGVPEILSVRDTERDSVEKKLLDTLAERHMPVHEGLLFSDEAWSEVPTVVDLRARTGLHHVLLAPIVQRGNIAGVLYVAHRPQVGRFSNADLGTAAALCAHISERLARLRSNPLALSSFHPLTKREKEISELVGNGLTNSQIGSALSISENTVKFTLKGLFRKLEVSSRAELTARIRS